MTALADAVLPAIRTRRDVAYWHTANDHGAAMHRAIDHLEAEIPDVAPGEAYRVAHAALASAVKVIARADDSSGIIGDACRRLLAMHPELAARSGVAPSKLVDWMMTFQFEGDVDYFTLDPVAYAPALGEVGMRSYRQRLDEVRRSLTPVSDESERWRVPDRHERWVIEWNDRRLAVFDRDVEAIIRTHGRDRRVAAWLLDTARALDEIGETALAIDWARQATELGPWHQSVQAADFWCVLLARHSPDAVVPARRDVFRRWPSASTAAALHRDAGAAWPTESAEVTATLARQPHEAVTFSLHSLRDPRLAWQQAHELALDSSDDRLWADLVKSYAKLDPLAVLPVHRRLVDHELSEADAKRYRAAARRLVTMRKLAAGTDEAPAVDRFVAELRDTHRRRPRLQQEFDRAGLP